MLILAYFCTGFFFLVLAAVLTAIRCAPREGRTAPTFALLILLSGFTLLVGLGAFIAVSTWVGLMTFGQSSDWRYPAQYLSAGPIGWLAGLLPLIALVSPLAFGWLLSSTLTKDSGNP